MLTVTHHSKPNLTTSNIPTISGIPVSITIWGRSGSKGAKDKSWLYQDDAMLEEDVAFLHKVDAVLRDMIRVDKSLARVESPLKP